MAKTVTDENFETFVSKGVSLVDLYADWCGPCKQIAPIIDDLSTDYDQVGKMDVDENPETMRELGIRSIPTILIYKDGVQVDRHVGMAQKVQLQDLIDKHLD
jgi:thioredoxin 1